MVPVARSMRPRDERAAGTVAAAGTGPNPQALVAGVKIVLKLLT